MEQPTQTFPPVTEFTLLDWMVLEEAVDRDLGVLLPLVVSGKPTPAVTRGAIQDLLVRVRQAIAKSPPPAPDQGSELFTVATVPNDLMVAEGLQRLFGVAAGVAKTPTSSRSFAISAEIAHDLRLRMVFGNPKSKTPTAA